MHLPIPSGPQLGLLQYHPWTSFTRFCPKIGIILLMQCAGLENIHNPPQKGLEFPGGGVVGWWDGVRGSVRPKNLEKCMRLIWNFQRGGDHRKDSLRGGGMEIFWNYTMRRRRSRWAKQILLFLFNWHHSKCTWTSKENIYIDSGNLTVIWRACHTLGVSENGNMISLNSCVDI